MRSILDPDFRRELLSRFRRLRPDTTPHWGRMSAPQMVAHLSDQMRHTIGEATVARRSGPLRWPIIKQAVLYLMPWGWFCHRHFDHHLRQFGG